MTNKNNETEETSIFVSLILRIQKI